MFGGAGFVPVGRVLGWAAGRARGVILGALEILDGVKKDTPGRVFRFGGVV
jgi:hypothetical protein